MTLSKKIFIASSVIFMGALLFWGVYNLSFKEKKQLTVPEKKEGSQASSLLNTFKGGNKEKITAVSDDKAVSPIISNDGNALSYYEAGTGKVFQVDLDGNNKKTLSDKNISEIKNVFWSPDKNKAIAQLKTSDGEARFSYYNYLAKIGGMLNENITSAIWQNSDRIVYAYFDPSKKTSNLSVSNPDGSERKKLADLNYAGQKIALVPQSGLISFWNNPDANYETSLFSLSPIQSEKKMLFNGKFGGDFLWNQQGTKLLVSHSNEKNGKKTELAVMDNKGGGYKNLELPTFVSKCVWAKNGKEIFCALPGNMPDNSVLPNDYIQQKFLTTDTFWKVDTETGKKTRIIELTDIKEKIDAQNFLLNSDESRLFFINRYDEKIYRINL